MNRRHTLAVALALARHGLAILPLGGALLMSGCAKREAAPDVGYTLLDGQAHQLAGLRGKVVFVNFWATSCTTCVQEMPEIVATHQKFATGAYTTLAVAMSYDPPAYVDNFAKTRGLPFGVAIDNTGAIAKQFGDVRLTPTSFLLDKRGGIVKKYVGTPDFAALHQLITELMAEA